MSLDNVHLNKISRAIRGLCLCRVYLQTNAAISDTILQVGVDDTVNPGLCLPGAQSFLKTSLGVRVVQPKAVALAGAQGIEHSETMTAVEPIGDPLHLTLTAPLTKAYTTDREAYVERTTKPAVCSGLKTIIKDFTEGGTEPEDKLFPGIFVTYDELMFDSHSNCQYNENLTFVVRYAMLEQDGVDNREQLLVGSEQLINLLREDNYLGGTVHLSEVRGAIPCWSPKHRMHGRGFHTAEQRRIIWVDIMLECERTVVWDKVSG